MKTLLEEIFVTEGIPQYTFVKPPNYNEILLDVRKKGKKNNFTLFDYITTLCK